MMTVVVVVSVPSKRRNRFGLRCKSFGVSSPVSSSSSSLSLVQSATKDMRYRYADKMRYECRPMLWVRVFEIYLSCSSDFERLQTFKQSDDATRRVFFIEYNHLDRIWRLNADLYHVTDFFGKNGDSICTFVLFLSFASLATCLSSSIRLWYYNVQNTFFDACASLRLSTTPPFERTAARRRAGRRPDPVCTRRAVECNVRDGYDKRRAFGTSVRARSDEKRAEEDKDHAR